jgi:hypothetical protein
MLLLLLLMLLLQVSGDSPAGCIVTATYNTFSAMHMRLLLLVSGSAAGLR